MLEETEFIQDKYKLEEDFSKNKLFKKDMQKIVEYVTSFVPLVGIIFGGLMVGSHALNKTLFDMPGKKPQEQATSNNSTGPKPDQQEQEESLEEE